MPEHFSIWKATKNRPGSATRSLRGSYLFVRLKRLVKKLAEQPRPSAPAKEKSEEEPKVDPNVRAAIEELEMALGHESDGSCRRPRTAGRIEIQYYSQEDLDRIYSVIVK